MESKGTHSVVITAKQRDMLLEAEQPDSGYDEMRIPLIEDYALPSDFAYRREDGMYDIDYGAFVMAARAGFDWDMAAQGYHSREKRQ